MRRWTSRLYLPSTLATTIETQEAGPDIWPACHRCSGEMGTRWAVESYEIADHGRTPGGTDYIDVRAHCRHGSTTATHEDVVRIEGARWEDAGQYAHRLAAIAAISFFSPGESRVIPRQVYLSFVGAH